MKTDRPVQAQFFALMLIAALAAGCTAGDKNEKPNILFIYTDDHSTRTVSAYPDAYPWARTPNIDVLAAEGISFRQVYSR